MTIWRPWWTPGAKAKPTSSPSLMNEELADQPDAKKALAHRPQRRAGRFRSKPCCGRNAIFFITVGAGHLAGPDGVPALLRKAGYKVDGP